MPLPRDDSGGNRGFRQVARRYFESEVLAMRQELADRRAETERLRAALERIGVAEPQAEDIEGLQELVDSIRAIARETLASDHKPGP